MDQLAIQTIEHFLQVPLIAPERIHEIDAKEIAAALDRIDDERIAALEETEDASWDDDKDMILLERLEEVTLLLRGAIDTCESCNDDNPCDRCRDFKRWIMEA